MYFVYNGTNFDSNILCTYVASSNALIIATIALLLNDWPVLILYIISIINISKMVKNNNNNDDTTEKQVIIKRVNERLIRILTRILSCSLTMQLTFILAVIAYPIENGAFNPNNDKSRRTPITGVLFLSLDAYVNVYCTNLMLEHNTKKYQLIVTRIKNIFSKIMNAIHSCTNCNNESEIIDEDASESKVTKEIKSKANRNLSIKPSMTMLTRLETREVTTFGVEKSQFVSQNQASRDETFMSSPV